MPRETYNTTAHHYKSPKYPVDMYLNYLRSIALEVERRVINNPPSRPGHFFRIIDEEKDRAKIRMRRVSGTFQNLAKEKSDEA